MTNSGMSDELIITQIVNNGVQQRIGVSEVIALHQNGVREPVIQALQAAPIGQASIQSPYPYEQAPVVRTVATPVVTPVVVRPVPVPSVVVRSTPVYRRPTPSYHRGRSPARYPAYGGKYRGPKPYSGGSIRIGF